MEEEVLLELSLHDENDNQVMDTCSTTLHSLTTELSEKIKEIVEEIIENQEQVRHYQLAVEVYDSTLSDR